MLPGTVLEVNEHREAGRRLVLRARQSRVLVYRRPGHVPAVCGQDPELPCGYLCGAPALGTLHLLTVSL